MTDERHTSMTLGEHLEELRRRVVYALLGLLPILILGFVFGAPILRLLIGPVERALLASGQAPTLQALSPLETFGSYIKVGVVVAVLIGVPWIVTQLWLFVRPGLYEHERRFARLLVPLSVALTGASAVFLYTVMLPAMLFFLINFGTTLARSDPPRAPLPEGVVLPIAPILAADPIDPPTGAVWINGPLRQLRVHMGEYGSGDGVLMAPLVNSGLVAQQYRLREYVDLVFNLGLAFAFAFQMPIVVLLLSWSGLVEMAIFTRYRRHIALACIVISAILTPADPITMMLMFIPLYLLFEFGLLLARFIPARRAAGAAPGAAPGVAPGAGAGWTDANEGDE